MNLLSSEKFSEKQTGYLAMGLFLNETHEMVPLIINSMLNDLTARIVFILSLSCIRFRSLCISLQGPNSRTPWR